MKKIAGILRAELYSPNNVGNDAAIFNMVADQLRRNGYDVRIYDERQFQTMKIDEDVIINMCRERKSISKLQDMEKRGRLVINSGFGIENCARERMTRIFLANNIPYPDSIIVDTDEDVCDQLDKHEFMNVWIKRGDSHAVQKEDVSFCQTRQDVKQTLNLFSNRGIRKAVINRHLEGDLIKFYGVQGQDWFYWSYPYECGHSKYGYEVINGVPKKLSFDLDALKKDCQHASEVLNVKIFGGDCIVDEDGTVRIIDFNDWPSFAPCRDEAVPQIAECVLKNIKF